MSAQTMRTAGEKLPEKCSPRPLPRSPVWGEMGEQRKKVFPRPKVLDSQRFPGHWGNGGTLFRKYRKIEIIEIIRNV